MSLVIFGDSFSFPDGDASTNRVHAYAKGFYENGSNVHVICFASDYNTEGDGEINGISFHHPFGQRRRSKYFIIRRWYTFLKYIKTIILFRKLSGNEKISAVIVYTMLLDIHLFAWFLARINRSKLLKECGEHPLRYHQKGALNILQGRVKLYIESRLSDGILCISQFLVDFFKSQGLSQRKLFLVPSTVDTSRFNLLYKSPVAFQYILYCGSLTVIKDGVNILIESFARISEKYPELHLLLVGKVYTAEEEAVFKNLVARLNLVNKVIFTGLLPRTEIPAYMINAKILALARPKSMIADAGFPSKLTEYLSTGVPVVVTEVGDIPVYLKDKESAFISKPDSVDAFADKLDQVLGNYHFAKEVAKKGKELTETVFNYKYQSKQVIEYVDSMNGIN